jgi:hypothetical protein
MSYGFTCFNCTESIDFDDLPTLIDENGNDVLPPRDCNAIDDEAERRAGLLGWCIGHLNGPAQGYISCPNCREAMFDARPLGRRAQRRAAP